MLIPRRALILIALVTAGLAGSTAAASGSPGEGDGAVVGPQPTLEQRCAAYPRVHLTWEERQQCPDGDPADW